MAAACERSPLPPFAVLWRRRRQQYRGDSAAARRFVTPLEALVLVHCLSLFLADRVGVAFSPQCGPFAREPATERAIGFPSGTAFKQACAAESGCSGGSCFARRSRLIAGRATACWPWRELQCPCEMRVERWEVTGRGRGQHRTGQGHTAGSCLAPP